MINNIKRNKGSNYYLIYTLIWILTASFAFSGILFHGKSFIIFGDGFDQHYTALKYYGIFLRNIARELLINHRLVIQDWDFNIGEGSDILTTLHYYCIGDPLTILSAIVPAAYTHYLFTFLGLLRLYLAGVSFSLLAFATGNRNKYAVLAGALTYSLSYWGMTCATSHPYFVNPMIYFPLMILGIENILSSRKPNMFIISTAIAAASNLYFFYVLALLTVCYTVIRLFFFTDHLIKDKIRFIFIIGTYALISICIAGAVFLPVAISYAGDSRLSVKQPFHLFYPLLHYTQIPGALISDSTSYATVSIAVPTLISVIHLISTKRTGRTDRLLKTLLLILFVFCLFPIFGRLFNVMSYATNRWVFAFSLLCSYILTFEWDNVLSMDGKSFNRLFISGCIFYLCLILLNNSRLIMVFAMLSLFFITLLNVRSTPPPHIKHKSLILSRFPALPDNNFRDVLFLFNIFICVILFGIWHYSPSFNNAQKNLMSYMEVADADLSSETVMFSHHVWDSASDSSDLLRISGRNLSRNSNILNHISSTQFYWSMSNPYMVAYRASLEMPDPSVYSYSNYDDRSVPTALASVKYYLTSDNNSAGIPYGYEYVTSENIRLPLWEKYNNIYERTNGYEPAEAQLEGIRNRFTDIYSVFGNSCPMPLTYCYNSYIYELPGQKTSDPVIRQQLQLDACYTDQVPEDVSAYKENTRDYHIPKEIRCNGNEITRSDKGFITTSYNTTADITFSDSADSETYIRFKNFRFIPTYGYDLYNDDLTIDPLNHYTKADYRILDPYSRHLLRTEKMSSRYDNDVTISVTAPGGVNKSFNYRSPEAPFSSGRCNYIINLGYHKEPLKSSTITFPLIGIYEFDDIEIYNVPMESFTQKIDELSKYHLTDVIMDTDSISGDIYVPSSKILTLSTPFSNGWKAYLDNVNVSTMMINDHYIGVEIPPGKHHVVFIYSTPFKKQGLILSIFGILIILVLNSNFKISLKQKNELRSG